MQADHVAFGIDDQVGARKQYARKDAGWRRYRGPVR
jgi:hypothetical protein